jgi:hypothetical protein
LKSAGGMKPNGLSKLPMWHFCHSDDFRILARKGPKIHKTRIYLQGDL